MKKLCVVQMHYTDLTENLKNYNCVEKLVKSNIFDKVVIAAADINQNSILKNYASNWNIDIKFGSVRNVLARISNVIEENNSQYILRVLPSWYFIDLEIIKKIFDDLISKKGDYAFLPRNLDTRFIGDIFSSKLFNEIKNIIDQDQDLSNDFQFNPWAVADLYPEKLNSKIIDYSWIKDEIKTSKKYSAENFQIFKNTYHKIWPEHWDKSDSPHFPYKVAMNHNPINSKNILDIACGPGSGTNFMATESNANIKGIDVSKESIEIAKKRYDSKNNITFKTGDALEIEFPKDTFDLIVSIHTMEHVIDDNLFLKKIKNWLKRDCKIILEVPLLMEYPFYQSAQPYSEYHIREYIPKELVKLFSKYFKIIESYGVSRGFYSNLNKARNAILLVGLNSD